MELQFLTADQWGIRWKVGSKPATERQPDPEGYLHHSAGNHPTNAAQAFRLMNSLAIMSGELSAVGYDTMTHMEARPSHPLGNLVTIGEGRGPYRSAATLDRNEEGEANCLLGYFHPGHALSRRPHPDELEGCAHAFAWMVRQGWLAAGHVLRGHRDNPAHPGATACPGDYLYPHIPAIRARTAAILNGDTLYEYFNLQAAPATLWQIIAPGVAMRVEPEVLANRGGLGGQPVPVLSPEQARHYAFIPGGLPVVSVR